MRTNRAMHTNRATLAKRTTLYTEAMLGRLVVLFAAAGCGRIGFDASTDLDDAAVPFDGAAWAHHGTFEVVNATNEALRDVPILVRLDGTRIDYASAASDGRDLRFTDANGELSHEIERWDPQGASIVWVRVPLLAASPARTMLSMHYGNPTAQAVAGDATWSSDFVAVFHFAGSARDSTANRIAMNTVASTTPVFPDFLGQALAMAGPPAYAVIPDIASIDAAITYSGWFRSASPSPGEFEGMIVRPVEDSSQDSPYLGFNDDQVFFETYDSGGTNEGRILEAVPNNTWIHLALVERATSVVAFANGAPRATLPTPNGPFRPALPLFLGADCDQCPLGTTVANSDFLDGAIDEIRLERVERSPTWWVVQNASMRDTLIAWP